MKTSPFKGYADISGSECPVGVETWLSVDDGDNGVLGDIVLVVFETSFGFGRLLELGFGVCG
jgi:hypothetical protein